MMPSNRNSTWLSPPSLLASDDALGLLSRIVVVANAQISVSMVPEYPSTPCWNEMLIGFGSALWAAANTTSNSPVVTGHDELLRMVATPSPQIGSHRTRISRALVLIALLPRPPSAVADVRASLASARSTH